MALDSQELRIQLGREGHFLKNEKVLQQHRDRIPDKVLDAEKASLRKSGWSGVSLGSVKEKGSVPGEGAVCTEDQR